eukprot:850777-Pleurochrysis_carterae.AAC.1
MCRRPAPAARNGESRDGQTDGSGDGTGGAQTQGAEHGSGEVPVEAGVGDWGESIGRVGGPRRETTGD